MTSMRRKSRNVVRRWAWLKDRLLPVAHNARLPEFPAARGCPLLDLRGDNSESIAASCVRDGRSDCDDSCSRRQSASAATDHGSEHRTGVRGLGTKCGRLIRLDLWVFQQE